MTASNPRWVLDCLKRQSAINRYARNYYQPRVRQVEKILIYHPDEYRRYLKQHPCAACGAKPCCDRPCEGYLHWQQIRKGR